MSWLEFSIRDRKKRVQREKAGRGFLVFESTSEVIRAESLLKQKGWDIRVMGPPPEVRQGVRPA